MTQTQKQLATSMKPREIVWIGETRARKGTEANGYHGDPGSVYGIRCTATGAPGIPGGFEIVESPVDKRGSQFPVEGTRRETWGGTSVAAAYAELREMAREMCDVLYR